MKAFAKSLRNTILDNRLFKVLLFFLIFMSTLFISNNIINITNIDIDNANEVRIEQLESEIDYLKEIVKTQNDILISLEEKEVASDITVDTVNTEICFNKDNIREASNLNNDSLKKLLEGSYLEELSDTFIYCEQTYDINALFLIAIVDVSTANGTAERMNISNNMTGMGVSELSPNGYIYADKEICVIETARHLCNNYLNSNGLYYEGTSIDDISIHYCPNDTWIDRILNSVNELTL